MAGAVVTIDAMGCQREVARTIVERKGDYVLALKGNQPALHEAVTAALCRGVSDDPAWHDAGSGRNAGQGAWPDRATHLLGNG